MSIATEDLPSGSLLGIAGDAQLALVHNTCKNADEAVCKRDKADICVWDRDEAVCRPKTCTNLYGSDCKELSGQCLWKWDSAANTGECQNKAHAEFKDNPCKGLKGSDCRSKSEVCAWDWDKESSTGNCRPRTCTGIKGTDCRALEGLCTWKWDKETKTGECLNAPKDAAGAPTYEESGRSNSCKDLDRNECIEISMHAPCTWDSKTRNCRPTSCAGIKGSDCKELVSQCKWEWDEATRTGKCLNLPKAASTTTSTTTTASAKLMDNPCKDLKGNDCAAKSQVCVWVWDNCRPKSCAGIKGSHCKELASQCAWEWDEAQKTGKCLDLPKAPLTGSACFELNEGECNKPECKWQPQDGKCKSRTCVGLKGTHCRELPDQCIWKWDAESKSGECVDIGASTATTTPSAGSRAMWLFSLLLANALVTMGVLVL